MCVRETEKENKQEEGRGKKSKDLSENQKKKRQQPKANNSNNIKTQRMVSCPQISEVSNTHQVIWQWHQVADETAQELA